MDIAQDKMKKHALSVVILCIISLVLLSSKILADGQCVDDDGGKIVNVASTTRIVRESSEEKYWDSCKDEFTVNEVYCDSTQAKSEDIACPEGLTCSHGG